MNYKLSAWVPIVALSACDAATTYEPVVVENVTFTKTDTTLTFVSSNGISTTLTRNATYNYGGFIGALQATGETQGMIAIYQSDDATAAMGTRHSGEDIAYTTSYQRLREIDRPIIGSASYSGAYVGAFVNPASPAGVTPSQIRGDLALDVSFGGQTVEGAITNRKAYILGYPFEFILNDENGDIELRQSDLGLDGQFEGVAAFTGAAAGTATGTYSGLIAGQGGSEVVGAVRLGDETGVFAGSEN